MAPTQSTQPTLFLIRHGEKPPKVDGKEPDGLSAQGEKRAEGLRKVFGKGSSYNIGYIMAEEPKLDSDQRPSDTVQPLSEELNLKIHENVKRDHYEKAAKEALSFEGPGNLLLCWEHHALANIAKAIGVQEYAPSTGWPEPVKYPGSMFDLIWVIPPPYTEITGVWSEKVPGLDDAVKTNSQGDVIPPEALRGMGAYVPMSAS
ncbi:hypothetical protein FSARC_2968 [Fusarium sarcochroum]|uniref:Phosphoglycerate mutase family protein n=1 Tax=Fusarium sarcochroum TaxID=1208366 RepID=A0A8H4U4V6_9HYPO|nr:hypothetical protein FSARC_2968 [Fusarium sarcochroum]